MPVARGLRARCRVCGGGGCGSVLTVLLGTNSLEWTGSMGSDSAKLFLPRPLCVCMNDRSLFFTTDALGCKVSYLPAIMAVVAEGCACVGTSSGTGHESWRSCSWYGVFKPLRYSRCANRSWYRLRCCG